MLSRILCSFLAIASLVLGAVSVSADVVVMRNGDRMTGDIVRLEGNNLHLKTAYVEDALLLPWPEVASIESDAPVTVKFNSGEIIKGRLLPAEEKGVFVISGEMITGGKVRMSNVQAINPSPVSTTTFDGSITFGGNRQSGNTDRNALSAALDTVIRSSKHRFTLGFVTNYAEEDDQITERNTFGRFKYDLFYKTGVRLPE